MSNICTLFGEKTLISLGYNCFPKRIIDNVLKRKGETNFFDYIGTSMWGINDILLNDFENFINLDMYDHIDLISNVGKSFVHVDYYVRPFHDLHVNSSTKRKKDYIDKYLRRQKRLEEYLTSENEIVFIRLQEDMKSRIIHEKYKEKYDISEFEHINRFANIVKTKYNKRNFHIIYLTTGPQKHYEQNNIISIQIPEEVYNLLKWENVEQHIKTILLDNIDYINGIIE